MQRKLLDRISSWLKTPFSTRDNDQRLSDALRDRTTLSSMDIFQIEFGDQLPQVIQDETAHNLRDMQIIPVHKDPHSSKLSKLVSSICTYGYVYGKQTTFLGGRTEDDDEGIRLDDDTDEGNNQIFMNDFIGSKPAQVALMYLTPTFYIKLAKAAMATPVQAAIASLLYLDPFSSSFKHSIFGPLTTIFHSKANTVGHEHIHNLQKIAKEQYDPYDNNFQNNLRKKTRTQSIRIPFGLSVPYVGREISLRKIRAVDNFFSEGMVKYFGSDVELQARLHTIVARAISSSRWTGLPQSHEQLCQALISEGLKAPKSIRTSVSNHFEQNPESSIIASESQGRSLTRIAKQHFTPEILEVNIAYNAHYIEENRKFFWEKTLPYLYSHLLEMYGDEHGREKMGFHDQKIPEMVDVSARSHAKSNVSSNENDRHFG